MILAFNIQNVLIGGAFVGVLGLVLGVALGIIGKVFFVKVDEREIQVRECLPGNNLYKDGFAQAVVDGVGYTVTFNIRDKGKSQYQYLIEVKENGHTVSHTALESLRRTYRASTNNRVTQPDPVVNTQSMQDGREVIINKNKAKQMLGTIGVQPSELTSIVDLAKGSLPKPR